jgi:hypothetical protein
VIEKPGRVIAVTHRVSFSISEFKYEQPKKRRTSFIITAIPIQQKKVLTHATVRIDRDFPD